MQQFQLRQQQASAQAAAIRNSQAAGNVSQTVQFHPIPLATFSQIPGAIPHSYSSSGRVLTPAEMQTRFNTRLTPLAQAYANMNALGFILVPAANDGAPFDIDSTHRGIPSNPNGFQIRDHLSVEQRRAILERLLVFTTYHGEDAGNTPAATTTTQQQPPTEEEIPVDRKDPPMVEEAIEDDDSDNDGDAVQNHLESGTHQETAHAATQDEPVDFAFPLHEEPEAIEKTCAICLDEFETGEPINDVSKCPHVFHRECLLSWLDRHNVCPCCRRPMVTETDWQSAAGATNTIQEADSENSNRATIQYGGGT